MVRFETLEPLTSSPIEGRYVFVVTWNSQVTCVTGSIANGSQFLQLPPTPATLAEVQSLQPVLVFDLGSPQAVKDMLLWLEFQYPEYPTDVPMYLLIPSQSIYESLLVSRRYTGTFAHATLDYLGRFGSCAMLQVKPLQGSTGAQAIQRLQLLWDGFEMGRSAKVSPSVLAQPSPPSMQQRQLAMLNAKLSMDGGRRSRGKQRLRPVAKRVYSVASKFIPGKLLMMAYRTWESV